jgi:MoCo/4Fe-4S cofactor protein with predicted Tat translocation signal
MSNSKKTYWKGLEQLKNDPHYVKHADKEFVDLGVEQDPGHSRRDFLKMMGFSVAAASLAACEAPIRKAIPYVNKPVDVDPSIPNYYASSYLNGGDYCSIVVKTREGRPIKI